MSLLPAFLRALARRDDRAPPPEPDPEPRGDVFNLIPAHAQNSVEEGTPEKAQGGDETPSPPATENAGRNVHALGAMDLSRLSIDNDGRLYWDGKPVEVRRRLMLSRTQAVWLNVIGAFIVVGAVGATIQASAAARDWACRLGWTTAYCSLPETKPTRPPARPDIPA
jgi:hypothetical protein